MNNYVKWFCESFMNIEYESKPLLSFWLVQHSQTNKILKAKHVNINIQRDEQMTIFDI